MNSNYKLEQVETKEILLAKVKEGDRFYLNKIVFFEVEDELSQIEMNAIFAAKMSETLQKYVRSWKWARQKHVWINAHKCVYCNCMLYSAKERGMIDITFALCVGDSTEYVHSIIDESDKSGESTETISDEQFEVVPIFSAADTSTAAISEESSCEEVELSVKTVFIASIGGESDD